MKKTGIAVWGSLMVLSSMATGPAILEAQTPTPIREYQEQLQQARMEAQEVRLARIQEARALTEEHVSRIREHQHQELQERLVHATLENRLRNEERAIRALARQEEAQARALERAVRGRFLSEEARVRAERAAERAQQVVVRMASRVRIGVSLDVRQGRELDGQGAMVKGVTDDSPAEDAGIQEGDIITHLDGHSLLTPLEGEMEDKLDEYESLPVQRLMALARELEDGQEVEVRYLRDGEEGRVSLQAAEVDDVWTHMDTEAFTRGMVVHLDPESGRNWTLRMPEAGIWAPNLRKLEELEDLDIEIPEIHLERMGRVWAPSERDFQLFRGGDNMVIGFRGAVSRGLTLRELTPELGEYFSSDRGVLVLDVSEESEFGLLPGDVILSIDGRDVDEERDVLRILRSYEEGESVTFQVMRHGQEIRVQGTVD